MNLGKIGIFARDLKNFRQIKFRIYDRFRLYVTKRSQKHEFSLDLPRLNEVTFGSETLRIEGSNVWDSLPYHIKVAENLEVLIRAIKFLDRKTCSSNICSIYT